MYKQLPHCQEQVEEKERTGEKYSSSLLNRFSVVTDFGSGEADEGSSKMHEEFS